MESQHHAIAESIDAVTKAQELWTRTADAGAQGTLATELRRLEKVLTEHLTLEEEAVLPLIHENLTVAEWLAPQKHAMNNAPRRLTDKLLTAGIVLEGATEPERAWFMGEMPPPARVLWRLVGARQYAAHQRTVREL
jgi:hypothetical protein